MNDLNNHYLHYNDKKILKLLNNKKEYINNINNDIDLYTEKVNDIYYHCNIYNDLIKIDWEKEQLNNDYNHNLSYGYKEGLNDLELENRPTTDCYKAIKKQTDCYIDSELHLFLINSEKRHKKQTIDNLNQKKLELKKQLLSHKIDNATYYEKVKKINKDIEFYNL